MNVSPNRARFLAMKIKAGLTLSQAEQSEWERGAFLGVKVAAGLPLTADEQEQWRRVQESRVSVRHGTLYVEAPPLSTEEWHAQAKKSHAAPTKLIADGGTDK